jgi:hypothetical protein
MPHRMRQRLVRSESSLLHVTLSWLSENSEHLTPPAQLGLAQNVSTNGKIDG